MSKPVEQQGFTIVELIVVILLISILTAVVVPRFFRSEPYEAHSDKENILIAARFARQMAMMDRDRSFCLDVTTTSYAVNVGCTGPGNLGSPMNIPGENTAYPMILSDSVSIAAADTFFFVDNLGNVDAAGAINVNGENSYKICIASTGYAYEVASADACL